MITLTDVARHKILGLLAKDPRKDLALRFSIDGRGPGGYKYRLGFVPLVDKIATDTAVDLEGFQVLIDGESAPNLQGANIDFVETLQESGFKIDNPNSPWADPLAQAVQRVLDQDINPAVASHGGFVVLHEVKDGTAYIELQGGCQGCGMAAVTLRQGIELRIKEMVPDIREVTDVTDHAVGANPYYAPSEDGHSPLSG
ncbi:MAG: iron-sulfur cluster assembly accessory protein [Candidatus Eisenbacteria bacterium]|uniref:Iron-sulfur cluster assembly accessory protein n=1 Tax=Eiseniibacteriota bacterium TaxID=2212470 RepID=A0A538UAB8_UNCEI|nr:MAG: iron-sulfur cluster assembly accessory protein [Candidatus Eisenbacteria bacterium]